MTGGFGGMSRDGKFSLLRLVPCLRLVPYDQGNQWLIDVNS